MRGQRRQESIEASVLELPGNRGCAIRHPGEIVTAARLAGAAGGKGRRLAAESPGGARNGTPTPLSPPRAGRYLPYPVSRSLERRRGPAARLAGWPRGVRKNPPCSSATSRNQL